MELRVLRYFDAVARLGSATAAAEELHVAQPAISRQIHALEREVGVKLFETRRSGSTLTPAGRRFHTLAAQLLQQARHAQDFATMDAAEPANLRLVCIPATMDHLVVRMIAAGEITTPHIATADRHELLEHLASDAADLALLIRRPPEPFASEPIRWLHVTVQVPPEHDPWEPGAPVWIEDLAELPFVALTQDAISRQRLDEAAARDGVPLRPVAETEHASVAQAIAHQRGIGCVVTEEESFRHLNAHPLHSRSIGCLGLYLYAAWDPSHYLAPAIEALLERFATTSVDAPMRRPDCVPERVSRRPAR